MVKIMVTGDNHIGLTFNNFKKCKDTLIESRFTALETLIDIANKEKCDLFIVTGDLFDVLNTKKVKRTVDILSKFHNEVYVLPGNHDFYARDSKLWDEFNNASDGKNITLLSEKEVYRTGTGINLYPAACDSKHSDDNALGWIKESSINTDEINIGVAHGTIEGLSSDEEGKYFCMSKKELESIPVDVWLIGHAHVPYPDTLRKMKTAENEKIYNVGTHAQTRFDNDTEGYGMILEIDKDGNKAKLVKSGECFFKRIAVDDSINNGDKLEDAVELALPSGDKDKTVLEIRYVGRIDYANKKIIEEINEKYQDDFLDIDYNTSDLEYNLDETMINNKFADKTITADFLISLLDDPIEAQLAYELFVNRKIKTERTKRYEDK